MSTRDEVEPGMSAGDLEREAARESRCCGAAMVRAEDGEGWMCEACQKPIEDETDALLWRAWRTLRLFAACVGGCALFGLCTVGLISLPHQWALGIITVLALGFCWWEAKDE